MSRSFRPNPRCSATRENWVLAWMLVLATTAVPTSAQDLPQGALPCITNAVPTNYGTFLFVQGASYQQTSQGPVIAIPQPSAFAWIELISPPSLRLSNAVVTGPGDFRAELAPADSLTARWSGRYPSESALNATLPPGPGSTRIDITLSNSPPFLGFFRFTLHPGTPPIPQLTNADGLDDADAGTNITLAWNVWNGATTDDRIHVELRDPDNQTVFSASTGCGGEFALEPDASSVTIPAGRLVQRTTYDGAITFATTLFAAQDRGTLLVQRGIYTRTTRFVLRTAGPEDSDVGLSAPRISATGSNLLFTISGTPRATYLIQSSTNLTTWALENVTVLPISGFANLSLPLSLDRLPKFWRAVRQDDFATAPTLRVNAVGPNRDFMQLTIEGTPGFTYRVEATTDLIHWNLFTPFGLTIPPNSTRVILGLPIARNARFSAFRAVTSEAP